MESLAILGIILLLAIPLLAVVALVQVNDLQKRVNSLRIPDLLSRLSSLEQRLSELEKAAHPPHVSSPSTATIPPTRDNTPVPTPPPPTVVSVPPSPVVSVPLPPHTRSPLPSLSAPILHAPTDYSAPHLENIIAGRWFNRIGIIALIGSVTWFLKYAFENNWIGPTGRVAIGILLGALMLPWSGWLLQRGYAYFSEGIAGLGAVVLYISVWAGCQYYTLYSRDAGFLAMIVITAAMAAIALGRNSQRIALLSLIGGFLTPLLVSSGRDEEFILFSYILLLSAGLMLLDFLRDWRVLGPLSFVLTQCYFWGWYNQFYDRGHLERTIIFATLFFALYAALPAFRAIRGASVHRADLAVALLNSFAFLAALYVMLWPQDRWPLTLFVLALSAAHIAIARLIPVSHSPDAALPRLLFAGTALTFATLAIPIRLEDKWITLAFSVEGAVLAWTGFRTATIHLGRAAYLLLAIAAFRLLAYPLPAPQFLFNERFLAYLVLIACFAVVVYAAHQFAETSGTDESAVIGMFSIAINAFALIALSQELWDHFGRGVAAGAIASGLAQHLALTLLWTVYAALLILLGVLRHLPFLRWQAIALFGLVVVKVFFYDSSYLDRFYRIVSFFIVGLVLMVISFLYQRRNAQGSSPS